MTDTIFAVSSGSPPAAIAVIRISGPDALVAARRLAGSMPEPRVAALRLLRDASREPLDRALVLLFPGPRSATGEDVVELHVHGGRAVVSAVLAALGAIDGLRAASPGEFTRRALTNGIIDLAQAEGLADLLEAESEDARVAALSAAEGAVGQQLREWQEVLLELRASVEVAIDYDDEGDVPSIAPDDLRRRFAALGTAMRACLEQPTVERLRDGPLVVLAGRPNAGKSSLFNALTERDAAIVTPIAGTTRDVIEATVRREGRAYRIVDTAGLVDATADPIERIGIERARDYVAGADLLLWLDDASPDKKLNALHIFARADIPSRGEAPSGSIATSIRDLQSIAHLWREIARASDASHGADRRLVLRERQANAVGNAVSEIEQLDRTSDPVLQAEHLHHASRALSVALGVDATEAMLDILFSRFCLGK